MWSIGTCALSLTSALQFNKPLDLITDLDLDLDCAGSFPPFLLSLHSFGLFYGDVYRFRWSLDRSVFGVVHNDRESETRRLLEF